MERNKVVDKIRKLLNLARNDGATEHEAEQALLQAQRLMAANGLDEGEVETELEEAEAPEPVEDQLERMPSNRRVPWKGRLAGVIARNFRCGSYWSVEYPSRERWEAGDRQKAALHFIGRKSDVAIAREVFSAAAYFAQLQCSQHVAARLARGEDLGDTRAARNAFLWGFCSGLSKKFAEQVRSNSLALVIVQPPEVKAAVDALGLVAGHGVRQQGDFNAELAGHAAGKAFSMQRKVGDGAKPRRLALPGKAES